MDQGVNAVIPIRSHCVWRVGDPRQSAPCWAVRGAQRGPGLGCATQTPWLQDRHSQLLGTEEPVGSSHREPLITLPVWPVNIPPVWQYTW